MKIYLDDMKFGKAEILANREHVIALRDSALKEDQFDWAVILSHTVGLLHHLAEAVDGEVA